MSVPSCFSRALEIVTLSLSNSYPGKQKKHFKICTLIQFSSIDYFSSILFPLIEAKNLHRPHKLMNAVNFHQIISLRYFLNFSKIQANSKNINMYDIVEQIRISWTAQNSCDQKET